MLLPWGRFRFVRLNAANFEYREIEKAPAIYEVAKQVGGAPMKVFLFWSFQPAASYAAVRQLTPYTRLKFT